jgi:hypothetical protein
MLVDLLFLNHSEYPDKKQSSRCLYNNQEIIIYSKDIYNIL